MDWRVVRVLVMLSILLVSIITVVGAEYTCGGNSYDKKRPIQINNTDGVALSYYQINVNITYDSDMQEDFDDICFKNESSDDTQPYWIESKENESWVNTWINITDVPASSWLNDTIFMYYGNDGVSSGSNITNTMIFGDDFSGDLSNWTITQSSPGNVQIVSGEARIKGSGTWNANGMASNVNLSRSVVLEWQSRTSTYIHGYEGYGVQPLNTELGLYFRREGSVATLFRALDGSLLEVGTKSTALATQKFILPSVGYTIYWNGTEEETNGGWATDNNKLVFQTYTNGQYLYISSVFAHQYTATEPTYTIGAEQTSGAYISSWNNNITNNQTLNFTIISNTPVQFNITLSNNSNDYFNWSVAGGDKGVNSSIFNWTFDNGGSFEVIGSATYTADNLTINKTWNVTVLEYLLAPVSPANNSNQNTALTLTAREWPSDPPYNWYASTDDQFINVIQQGVGSVNNETITGSAAGLSEGTTYYWRFKNNSGGYSDTWQFTTNTTAATPGRFNITVFEEDLFSSRIMDFNATVFDTDFITSKETATGWINLSSDEIDAGEFYIRVTATGYASRTIIADSPGNVTLYLPSSTNNTIDTIAFYLLDYTGLFPWGSSILSITKNNTIMHSSYFDADAKVGAYLIEGSSYKITVTNGVNLQEWGNYIPLSSGNVEVVLIDVGFDPTDTGTVGNFIYNITKSDEAITLRWEDKGILNNLSYTVYKGTSQSLVHQLITTVTHGQSEYIVTNTSDIYYIYFTANTTMGALTYNTVVDYRTGTETGMDEWEYGTFSVSSSVQNMLIVLFLMMLAASFGALHSGVGGIITGLAALFFYKMEWLSELGAGGGVLGGLVVVTIVYYLRKNQGVKP